MPWYKEVDGERERVVAIVKKKWALKETPLFIVSIENPKATTYFHLKLNRVNEIEQASQVILSVAQKVEKQIIDSKAKVKVEIIPVNI